MRFVPHNEKEKSEMLKEVGVASIEELFKDIPENVRVKGELKIGKPLSELELRREIEDLAAKNKSAKQLSLFLGAGCYNHFIPATVPAITGRSEFYTAYTPYQPEISQGMLQAIYEWQSWTCILTGMDLANASLYDGATACAEAMLMAGNARRRKKVLVSDGLNPEYLGVLKTYANANSVELKEIKIAGLEKELDENVSCLIVQQPNFFGQIEELKGLAEKLHEKKALLVVAITEALSLAFCEKPADYDADIVALEAQSFGNPMSFGGPHPGVIACKKDFVRQIPGRLVGKTNDTEGKDGFILTLQAREQHIRRERAGSNICSNQALCALASTVYLSTLGEKGLEETAKENHENAKYLAEKLKGLGFELPFGDNFFNEFVAKKQDLKEIHSALSKKDIVFGYPLEMEFPEIKDSVLLAVTEMNSKQEIDALVLELEELL